MLFSFIVLLYFVLSKKLQKLFPKNEFNSIGDAKYQELITKSFMDSTGDENEFSNLGAISKK